MKVKYAVLFLALVFFSLLQTDDASADYNYYEGMPKWETKVYKYWRGSGCEDFIFDYVDQAIEMLGVMTPSYQGFNYRDSSPDRRPTIFCNDDPESNGRRGRNTPADARVWRTALTNMIVDCDTRIMLNIPEDMILRILIHELGHCLGLRHTRNRESIMYFRITRLEEPLAYDFAALDNLYTHRCLSKVDSHFSMYISAVEIEGEILSGVLINGEFKYSKKSACIKE